jgi:hypothetical protein
VRTWNFVLQNVNQNCNFEIRVNQVFPVGVRKFSNRVVNFSGRFYGKLQSRSFPELSDATKEKPPVRQLSDNQPGKFGQAKAPVASTK